MANRYWVGGSGAWDNTNTTNWSASSGGSGGASVPTSTDNVFFDSNSSGSSYTVSLGTVDLSCGDITIDNPSSGTISISDAPAWYSYYFYFYGSFTNNAGTAINYDFNRYKKFRGTGTHTLKFDGANPFSSGDVYLEGTGTYSLTDAANWGILNLYHSAGTYNTNGYTHTGYRYQGSSTSTINMSNSMFNLQSGGFNATNTVNAGTSTVRIFNGGSLSTNKTLYNVKPDANSGNNTFNLSQNITCNKFILGVYTTNGLLNIVMFGDIICSELASEYQSGATNIATQRTWLRSVNWTTNRTINATTSTAKNVNFTNITFTNNLSDASWGDAEGNSNITFTGGFNVYYVGNGASTDIHDGVFATSSGGTVNVSLFPRPQDTLIIDENSPSYIDTDPGYFQFGSIDASARTSAFTFDRKSSEQYIYGDITCNSNFVYQTSSTSRYVNFFGSADTTIDADGANIQGIRIAKFPDTGSVTLSSNIDVGRTSSPNYYSFFLNSGTFDANGYDVYTDKVHINNPGSYTWYYPETKTVNLYMGEGNWYIDGEGTGTSNTTGATWNDQHNNPTYYAETSTVYFTSTGSGDIELRTQSQNLNNIVKDAGTGTLIFQTSFTVNQLLNSTTSVLTINSGVTLTLDYMETSGNIDGGGSIAWTGNRYFNGQNITVNSVNATSPTGFPAGPMFVGSSGTITSATGWTQSDAPIRYWVGGAGNWGATSHWSTSSGGTSGASIPGTDTEVIFDGSSGTGSVTFGNSNHNPTNFFNLYGDNEGTANISLSQSGNAYCYGDYVLDNSLNKSGNGSNYFSSARTGNRISTNGDQMYLMSFDGGGSYSLESSVYASLQSSNCFILRDVDFNSNGYSISSSVNVQRQFNRDVDFTNSYIRCFVDWTVSSTGTGTLTLTGTQIRFGGYATSSFHGGGFDYPFVENQNGSQFSLNFTGANSFDRLDLPGSSQTGKGGTTYMTSATQTINDNGQVTFKGWSANRRMRIMGDMVFGSNVTISAEDHDFQDFTATGATITGTRLGDIGGNTNVITDSPKTVYFDNWYNSFFSLASSPSVWAKLGSSYDTGNAVQDNVTYDYGATMPSWAGTNNDSGQLHFSPDGTKMFVAGLASDSVNEYTLTTAFDITTASKVGYKAVYSEETAMFGASFNPAGTKMYITGHQGDDVVEYDLSAAFDVSTAVYGRRLYIGGTPREITWKPDGTKFFITYAQGSVKEWDLTTAYDVTTGTAGSNYSIGNNMTASGAAFNSDGTRMFVIRTDSPGPQINQYSLSSAYDLSSTISLIDSISITSIGSGSGHGSMVFNPSGTKMFLLSAGDGLIHQFSTSSYDSNATAATENYPLPQDTLEFRPDAGAGTYTMELPLYTMPLLDFSLINTGDVSMYHDYTNDYYYLKGVKLGPNARYKQKSTTDNRMLFVNTSIPKILSGDLEGTHLKLLTNDEFTFEEFAPENLYIQGNGTAKHTNGTGSPINIGDGKTNEFFNFNGLPVAGSWYVGDSSVSGTFLGLIKETEEDSKSGSPLMMF